MTDATTVQNRPRIFLSYSWADRAAAEALSQKLEAEGLDVWWDQNRVTPGANMRGELLSAIDRSSAVVVLVGDTTERSSTQLSEVAWVESGQSDPSRPVIPVALGDARLPDLLSNYQAIGATPGDWQATALTIADAVRSHPKAIPFRDSEAQARTALYFAHERELLLAAELSRVQLAKDRDLALMVTVESAGLFLSGAVAMAAVTGVIILGFAKDWTDIVVTVAATTAGHALFAAVWLGRPLSLVRSLMRSRIEDD